MVLTVHHLHLSQSERVVWLCEELGIDYELKLYNRTATLSAPDDYKEISPLKTSPVIEDEDNSTPNPERIALAESSACIEWIARKYGQGRLINKPWEPNWKEWLFWWHFTNGSLQPTLNLQFVARDLPPDHAVVRFANERTKNHMHVLENRLGESKFLVGEELSAADVMVVFPLSTMRLFAPMDLSAYPNVLRYLGEIGERPAYVRAMGKADPGLKPLLEANPAAARPLM